MSGNDYASVPSRSIAPVVLVPTVSALRDNLQIRRICTLDQPYDPAHVGTKHGRPVPRSWRGVVPPPVLDLVPDRYAQLEVAHAHLVACAVRALYHTRCARGILPECAQQRPGASYLAPPVLHLTI